MPKPTISKHSTLVEMKAFVRKHKLNHPSVKLGMKKAEMLSALDKLGHINTEPRQKPAPKKKATPKKATPTPKKATPKKVTPKEKWQNWIAKFHYIKNNDLVSMPVIYHYDPDKKVFEVYFYYESVEKEEYESDYFGSVKKRLKTINYNQLNQKDYLSKNINFALDKTISKWKGFFRPVTIGREMMKGEYGIKREAEAEMKYYLNNI